MLAVKISTLCEWSQGFDDQMRPLMIPDGRGSAMKVTSDIVRRIVEEAQKLKASGRRLRLKSFTRQLATKQDIVLSRQKVGEILIANNLYKVRLKRRRPRFYQRLRQSIPNGLISVDGSEFTVWIDQMAYKFNLELAVDVHSFCHSAYRLSDTETSEECIKVIEAHSASWGTPLGLVADHGSANLAGSTRAYLERNHIELLPAGPANPKGNGSAEGAFSQMKQVIGPMILDTSSPKALAQCVLDKIVSIYIAMRNRLARMGDRTAPQEAIQSPQSEESRQAQRAIYKRRRDPKEDPGRKTKLDRLDWIITHHHLEVDEETLKQAKKCMVAYELEAISQSEEAFIRAIRRDPGRCNLAYFFGILKNIQNERDAGKYQDYCYQRYNYRQMVDREERKQQETQDRCKTTTVEDLVAMLQSFVSSPMDFIKELCIRQAKPLLQDLKKQYRYMGVLRRKIADALGEINELTLSQRKEALDLVEELLT